MKNLFLTGCCMLLSLALVSQTSNDDAIYAYLRLNSGIKKDEAKDYTGAINEFNEAIKLYPRFSRAYYCRARSEMKLEKFTESIADFGKAIELNPKYTEAYYDRATLTSGFDPQSAVSDLNKVIAADPLYKDALSFRGGIRAFALEDKIGGCDDLYRAQANNDPNAQPMIEKLCGDENGEESSLPNRANEMIGIPLPPEYNWKVAKKVREEDVGSTLLVPGNESAENWTQLFMMGSVGSGFYKNSLEEMMQLVLKDYKKENSLVKLTLVEKNETAENPWIIFSMDSRDFAREPEHASQLWFIMRGNKTVYINYLAVKNAMITNDTKKKWVPVFKASRVGPGDR